MSVVDDDQEERPDLDSVDDTELDRRVRTVAETDDVSDGEPETDLDRARLWDFKGLCESVGEPVSDSDMELVAVLDLVAVFSAVPEGDGEIVVVGCRLMDMLGDRDVAIETDIGWCADCAWVIVRLGGMVGDLGGDLVLRGLAEGERDSFGERVSEVDDLAEAVTEEEPVVLRDGMGE